MKMIESFHHAADHKLRGGVVEITSPLKGRPNVSAKTYFHEKIDILIILVCLIKSEKMRNYINFNLININKTI